MSPRPTPPCPHERGHATAICLLCRRDARILAQTRHRQLAMRGILALLVTGGVAAAIVEARTMFRGSGGTIVTERDAALGPAAEASATSTPDGSTATPAPATAAMVTSASAARVVSAPRAAAPMSPIVAEGRTPIGDSVTAIRTGTTVAVRFDTPSNRTRRADKFEHIVRTTLPAIYGPAVDTLLAAIPEGKLARGSELLTVLPTRGVRLPLAAGWTLAIWPETRPGQDGPLVIAYRASVIR